MKSNRPILLEGLPGTGKSTNSFFLLNQLERAGAKTRWFHEVARPHPVLFFDEAYFTLDQYAALLRDHPAAESALQAALQIRSNSVGIDLLEVEWHHLDEIGREAFEALKAHDAWNLDLDQYTEAALNKWTWYVHMALKEDAAVHIFDSALFQFQIFTFLLENAPATRIEAFVGQLIDILAPLNPLLIYLYRGDVRKTIDFLVDLRGEDFLERIWTRDQHRAYYSDKPRGAEGQKRFLLDYAALADRLFDRVSCEKAKVDITGEDWPRIEDRLLNLLGIERRSAIEALPPPGTFRAQDGFEMTVEGLRLRDPNGHLRALTPKSEVEFHIEGLPTTLRFSGADEFTLAGEQIAEKWTALHTRFHRI